MGTLLLRRIRQRPKLVLLVLAVGAAVVLAVIAGRELDKAITVVGLDQDLPFHQRIDRIRDFVNTNSIHKIDDEFWSYRNDDALVVSRLIDRYLGRGDPPHLECSGRSGVMGKIIRRIGMDVRSVSIYQHRQSVGFRSHTFLEVFNGQTSRWEIADPEYDLYYVDRITGARASTQDLLTRPLDEFIPCSESGRCGWHITSSDGAKAGNLSDYFGLAAVKHNGKRLLMVNNQRFDLEKPVEVDGEQIAYCDYISKNCRGEIILFEGD